MKLLFSWRCGTLTASNINKLDIFKVITIMCYREKSSGESPEKGLGAILSRIRIGFTQKETFKQRLGCQYPGEHPSEQRKLQVQRSRGGKLPGM